MVEDLPKTARPRGDLLAALGWLVAMGADEALEEQPQVWGAAAGVLDGRPAATGSPGATGGGCPSSPDRLAALRPLTQSTRQRPTESSLGSARSPAGPHSESRNPAGPALTALTTLDSLRSALDGLTGFSLRLTAMNLVFGEGDASSGVMVIGKAPGEEEDRQGRPFVGPDGRLLERMLGAIGLERRAVYLAPLLPWRPPGNRAPTAAEIATCLPYLKRQIEIVRPKVLILLGEAPGRALLDRSGPVARLRGRWSDYQPPDQSAPIRTLVTYHPEFLLRSPSHKRDAWLDLLLVRREIDQWRA